jgi:hypothetical protein
LNAQLAESQTRLGEALLPSATDALQFANDDLLPVLESTIATVGPQLAQTLRDSAPEIKEAITAIASTIPDAIDLAGKVLPVISASIEGDVRFLEDGQKTFDRTNQFFTEYLPRWAEGSVTVQESWEGFFNWWDLAWDGTADTVENKSDEIKDYWADTLAGMKAQAQQASLASEGVAFAQGFADGITSNEEAAILAAERMALAARDKVKNTMLIESPSRVMRELGRFVPEGFALGINDGVPFIDRAAERMATAASNVAAVTGGGSRSGGASGGPLVGELRVETHQGMSEQQVADLAIARLQFVLRGR